jgi:capsular polysaccharide biosynthesis protein
LALRTPAPLNPLWPLLKAGHRRSTRVLSPITRGLSRIRGGQLPLGSVATVDESIAGAGGRMWVARPEERILREMPEGEPPRHRLFLADTELVVPRIAVAELPGARVLGPHRVVVDRNNRMIEEFGLYWGTTHWTEHEVFWHPFQEPPLEVDGMLGMIAGRGDVNYYHFLMDVLPRLALLETEGVPTPDRWYVPLGVRFHREIFELAGFPLDGDVIDAYVHPHVRAETLLAPGIPDVQKRVPPWTVDFIRERLRPADLELVPGRRIYVTRGRERHNRIVVNEEEVVTMLAERGFTVVDPGATSVAEQIRMFAEAEVIVGPHGAALTNLLFVSPGASVIEFFAPYYVDDSYWKLVDCVPGVTYRYLLGTGRQPPARRGDAISVMADITVDLAALERALDSLPAYDAAR